MANATVQRHIVREVCMPTIRCNAKCLECAEKPTEPALSTAATKIQLPTISVSSQGISLTHPLSDPDLYEIFPELS